MHIKDPNKIIVAEDKKKKIFMGGTCNDSSWREDLIPQLEIDYFNPVVDDWTPECMKEEIKQRKTCDYVLCVITSDMTGVYSIAEVIDDSNKCPEKTIFCFLEEGFDKAQKKSLKQVEEMVKDNGATICSSLKEIAKFVNGSK